MSAAAGRPAGRQDLDDHSAAALGTVSRRFEGQRLLAGVSIRVSRRFPTAAAEGAGCLRLRDCGICLHGPIVAHPFARDHSGRSRHPGAQPGDGGCGSCLAEPLGFGHGGSSVLAGSDGRGDSQCR
jgi:hypothetical protein